MPWPKNKAQGATIDGMIKNPDANHLRTFGFLVLRQFFDPATLSAEMDRVLKDAFSSPSTRCCFALRRDTF